MTTTPTNNCPKHGGTMKSCNPNCAPKNRPAPLRFANAVDADNYAALKKSHAELIKELKFISENSDQCAHCFPEEVEFDDGIDVIKHETNCDLLKAISAAESLEGE